MFIKPSFLEFYHKIIKSGGRMEFLVGKEVLKEGDCQALKLTKMKRRKG
jgi:hypothetical protein